MIYNAVRYISAYIVIRILIEQVCPSKSFSAYWMPLLVGAKIGTPCGRKVSWVPSPSKLMLSFNTEMFRTYPDTLGIWKPL